MSTRKEHTTPLPVTITPNTELDTAFSKWTNGTSSKIPAVNVNVSTWLQQFDQG